jgi:hypothetical protein
MNTMSDEIALPDIASDDARFAGAVRVLRDHLLGAVDVDMQIRLNGRAYVVAWADRRQEGTVAAMFSLASGMRVIDHGDKRPEVVPSGEEQITLVVDGERFVFYLIEVADAAGISGRG